MILSTMKAYLGGLFMSWPASVVLFLTPYKQGNYDENGDGELSMDEFRPAPANNSLTCFTS